MHTTKGDAPYLRKSILLCFSIALFLLSLLFTNEIIIMGFLFASISAVIYIYFSLIVKGYQKELFEDYILVDTKDNIYFIIYNYYLIFFVIVIFIVISIVIMLFYKEFLDYYKSLTYIGECSFFLLSLTVLASVFYYYDHLVYKSIKKHSSNIYSFLSNKTILYRVYKVKVLKKNKEMYTVRYNNKERNIIISTEFFQYKRIINDFDNNLMLNKD